MLIPRKETETYKGGRAGFQADRMIRDETGRISVAKSKEKAIVLPRRKIIKFPFKLMSPLCTKPGEALTIFVPAHLIFVQFVLLPLSDLGDVIKTAG